MLSARAAPFAILLVLCFALAAEAKTWKLKTNLKGKSLVNYFAFESKQSDNGGVAYYNSYANAKKKGLVSIAKSGAVTLRVGTKKKQANRDSIRLVSKKTHNNGGLFVFDVAHIPTGFGTWPALWSTGWSWPNDGEIDIIEGVHNINMNSMSTHTGPGCTMGTSGFSGKFMMATAQKNQCNVYASDSQGCGVRSASKSSYGPNFNKKGGGVFALLWAKEGIKIYQWPRNKVPADIKKGKPTPSSKWGKPSNFVAPSSCHPFDHFYNQQIVINTNLCGTWAAGVWHQDLSYAGSPGSPADATGYSSCEDYVKNSGNKLSDAFWKINSIKIYQ